MRLINFILRLLRRKPSLNLSTYPKPGVDYGVLKALQRNAMDNILMACQLGGAEAEIPVLTQGEFDAVVTQIGLHFGNDELCKNIALKRQNAATINLQIYNQAKVHKAKLDEMVDEALRGMYAGSQEQMLRQIADWIVLHATYRSGSSDPLDLLGEGAMCGAYAMLFYKMATRLGLQAYICYGYASNGTFTGAHAWNKVDLPEGVRYYDITFYDGALRSRKWLGSTDGWGRQCSINDKSALRNWG